MRIRIQTLRKIIREELGRNFLHEAEEQSKSTPENQGPPTKDIILVNDGSFNPVHRGHVNVTLAAKKAAEGLGYNVIALYMAPKHRSWLENKFKGRESEIIPDDKRLEFLEDAISGTGIELDDWEISGGSFKDSKGLRDHYESVHANATFVMIIGEDYGKCTPMPCFEIENDTWQLRLPRTEGLSSTKIRGAAAQDEDMTRFTYPKVEKYMKMKYRKPRAEKGEQITNLNLLN